MRSENLHGLFVALGIALLSGCQRERPDAITSTTSIGDGPALLAMSGKSGPTKVFAQGQIQPASGIVRIYSTPGDTVVELPVQVGSKVEKGDTLAVMRSAQAIDVQRKVLLEQRKATEREQSSALRQAELRLSAALLKLKQIDAQRKSFEERAELLDLGEQQLAAARRMLESLEKITRDTLTHEFVGQLEVERQRIAVDDSRLKLAEQQTSYRQARTELELAEEAAKQETEAAEAMLAMAKEADAVSLIDERLKALDLELAQSVILAPSDGYVVALGAPIGGSAVQVPLVELADLERIVCEAEVNIADARRIDPGIRATISSPAFGKDTKLPGVVREKSRLVGRPQLRSPDPLAAADYRTVPVIIELDDPADASKWLQLQVEVVFELD